MTDINFEKHLHDIVDYAEPKMDVYEFAIYMYLVRHTRLMGKDCEVFGFKSIRKTMVIGVGEKNTPMSEGTCYQRLKSLELKGFIKVLDSVYSGQRIKVFLPFEIPELIQTIDNTHKELNIDEIDFFSAPEYRKKILDRENWKCFYCYKDLSNDNYIIEHVISRPQGDNSYKNLVASCRTCNNKKDNLPASDFARILYRENFITENEFLQVIHNLEKLIKGELQPKL